MKVLPFFCPSSLRLAVIRATWDSLYQAQLCHTSSRQRETDGRAAQREASRGAQSYSDTTGTTCSCEKLRNGRSASRVCFDSVWQLLQSAGNLAERSELIGAHQTCSTTSLWCGLFCADVCVCVCVSVCLSVCLSVWCPCVFVCAYTCVSGDFMRVVSQAKLGNSPQSSDTSDTLVSARRRMVVWFVWSSGWEQILIDTLSE